MKSKNKAKFNWRYAQFRLMNGGRVCHQSFKPGQYLFYQDGEIYTESFAIVRQEFLERLSGTDESPMWSIYIENDWRDAAALALFAIDIISMIGSTLFMTWACYLVANTIFDDPWYKWTMFLLLVRGFYIAFIKRLPK